MYIHICARTYIYMYIYMYFGDRLIAHRPALYINIFVCIYKYMHDIYIYMFVYMYFGDRLIAHLLALLQRKIVMHKSPVTYMHEACHVHVCVVTST